PGAPAGAAAGRGQRPRPGGGEPSDDRAGHGRAGRPVARAAGRLPAVRRRGAERRRGGPRPGRSRRHRGALALRGPRRRARGPAGGRMRRPACSWWSEIGRAPRPETDPRLAAHLETCDDCQAERRQIQRAIVMLQALPYEPPDEDAREQARTRLVAALGDRPPRPTPRRWLGRGVVVAASLCGSIVAAAVGTHVMQTRPEAPAFTPPGESRPRRPHPRVLAPAPMVAPEPAPALAPPPPVLA